MRTLCLGFLLVCGTIAQSPPVLVIADRAILGDGQVIENPQILIAAGKIVAIGTKIQQPDDCETLDLSGCTLTPGLVEGYTHAALGRGSASNEETTEVTPNYRPSRLLDGRIPAFERLLHLGVTTAAVHPGTRNVISGRICAVKTRGKSRDQILFRDDLGVGITLGLEATRGNGSARFGTPGLLTRIPNSRMGVVVLVRKAFIDAQEAKARGGPVDADTQTLIDLMDGKLVAFWKAPESKDVLTAKRLAEAFGIDRNVIVGSYGAHRVADDLKAWKTPVLLGRPGHRHTMMREFSLAEAAMLEQKGVLVAHSGGSTVSGSTLRDHALFGARGGQKPLDALASITSRVARTLGVADRVGSLEAGKDADIVAWSGDPLSPASTPKCVIIDGVVAYRPGEVAK